MAFLKLNFKYIQNFKKKDTHKLFVSIEYHVMNNIPYVRIHIIFENRVTDGSMEVIYLYRVTWISFFWNTQHIRIRRCLHTRTDTRPYEYMNATLPL